MSVDLANFLLHFNVYKAFKVAHLLRIVADLLRIKSLKYFYLALTYITI